MQLIKKYANRKLYHTNRKQYITLDGIARLLREGEVVQVLDNESGGDITASTLAQVVLQTRHKSDALPTNVLTALIHAGGDTIANLRRSLLTTVGAHNAVNGEIERRLRLLEAQGELAPHEAERINRLLLQAAPGPAELPALPSRTDVERLKVQVDELARSVEELLLERKTTGSP